MGWICLASCLVKYKIMKVINWIIDKLTRLKNWIGIMLSDDKAVSTKKVLGLLAFIMLIVVIIVSLIKTLTADNVALLRDSEKYLTGIVLVAIFGVAAVDIFNAFKKND